MDTGEFRGFNVTLRDPGIAWFQFSTPERLNGMTATIKRDLVEAVTQAQMDNGCARTGVHRLGSRLLCRRRPQGLRRQDSGRSAGSGDQSRPRQRNRHLQRPAHHLATRQHGDPWTRQAHHRRHQRRGHPDRILAWRSHATSALPHAGARMGSATLRFGLLAGRGWAVPARAVDGRGPDHGLPDEEEDRRGRRSVGARTRQRSC